MGLTLTEKDHFKSRITTEAGRRLDKIEAENATWRRDVQVQAETAVRELFDVDTLLIKYAKAREAIAKAVAHKAAVELQLTEQITGRSTAASDGSRYRYNQTRDDDDFVQYPSSLRSYVRNQVEHQRELLESDHEIGAQLAQIKSMKRSLLDRIVTCANHTQLTAVWEDAKIEYALDEGRGTRNVRIRDS